MKGPEETAAEAETPEKDAAVTIHGGGRRRDAWVERNGSSGLGRTMSDTEMDRRPREDRGVLAVREGVSGGIVAGAPPANKPLLCLSANCFNFWSLLYIH
ncbi:hypothetical protein CRG98_007446 [Punica granatum]|uniref:Uncharacterized protein n=1 Tax=Punica granatum TaxID=22663 RepID=A0A2I0KUM4_PUNGR|nr:hypothetical protein CRG98_007446 [Punica granatum]